MPRARMRPEVKARLADAARRDVNGDIGDNGSVRVAAQVRRWIFDGLLRDGDVVSQEDLADLFGVSRIPVRDALIALAGAGWIVLEPGIGARAVGLDAATVRDSFELMGTIWALLLRRGVERGGDRVALTLAAAAVRAATTPTEMTAANAEFIAALQAQAGSPRLDAAFRSASRIVSGDFFTVVPGAVDAQRRHVPKIAAAVRRGEVETAAARAVSLHRAHARSVGRLLAERGVLMSKETPDGARTKAS